MKKIVLLAFKLMLLSTVLSLCVVDLLELQIVHASPYTDIEVETAHSMITNGSYPNLVVLDVRTKSEYDSGHIYGAVWIPHTELASRIGELLGHKNHEIIVYCLSGGRSATASGILDSHNFTKVYNMLGGITAWQSAGYSVCTATVHNVDTSFNYDTIQAAIDSPQTLDGNTISVDAGTYYENVVVNKSISLIGENIETTIIDGNSAGNVIEITVRNVTIANFTIQNSSYNMNGIRIEDHYLGIKKNQNTTIQNNNIINNDGGISIVDSWGNNISGNNITDNYYGIILQYSYGNTLRDNHMSDNQRNFFVWSDYLFDFYHDIDSSNTVDGKPVYYWVSQQNRTVPVDAGYVALVDSINITIQNLTLKNNGQGLLFVATKNSTIAGNNLTNNRWGIGMHASFNNTITGNTITSNGFGIVLEESPDNTITGNTFADNYYGMRLYDLFWQTSNNTIYHNNFIDNTEHVIVDTDHANFWDNGYPSGGNYWNNYNGTDWFYGPNQNITGSDGVSDSPYVFDSKNNDTYPLMGPITFFDSGTWNEVTYFVHTVSNSTISDFNFSIIHRMISFNVTGSHGTSGFSRVGIPKELLYSPNPMNWVVRVNGTLVPFRVLEEIGGNHTYIYFTHGHSIQNVQITGTQVIPEFPTWTPMLLIFMMLTVAIALHKRRLPVTPIH